MTVSGSCLCGTVRFRLTDTPLFLNHCHCTMCRKAGGGAFGSFVHADGKTFEWLAGQDAISHYPSSPGNFRPFCTRCGSRVPVIEDDGAHVIIPAGTLDGDPKVRPLMHIHVSSKAVWYEISDRLDQFDAFPPPEFWRTHGIEA